MQTLRKRIVEALQKESLDLRQISKRLGIKEKEALDHLEHIERSLRPRQIMVAPAHCLQCGFSFRKRTRLSTPGRCPVCRGEQITPPVFRISS